jgi:hypothetical protein
MRFVATSCLLLLLSIATAAEQTRPEIKVTELRSPASANAVGAAFAKGPKQSVWLSWVEPGRKGINSLRYATLDPTTKKWRAARTIATGTDVAANPMDFPQLAVGSDGHATAVWTDGKGGAVFSDSLNGITWNQRLPWTGESSAVEMFSMVSVGQGPALAVWLDGRAVKSGAPTRLYAKFAGSTGPDVLIDASVCDCCPPMLVGFPDGTALVAYRGRTKSEVRDIRVARFRNRAWSEPRVLSQDEWTINGCPVNGPRLVTDGGRVGVTWFTAAESEPRVMTSYSPDAGTSFLMPQRIDAEKPVGQPDTLLLRDMTILTTWIAHDGRLWLRRINPEFSTGEPFAITPPSVGRLKGSPRIALLQDYAGRNSAAEFLVAATPTTGSPGIRMFTVTVPEGELLAQEKNCDCTPTPEELQGYAVRGTFAESLPSPGMIRITHAEFPGLFPEGTHEFHVDAAVLRNVQPGRQFLGRIERRNGDWWLFDVRVVPASR